ncbi:hypothetical protein H8S23_11755 [Anaerofilum sp. BX8]|uniref:Spore germination protein N-terminal domain-containing protein n=1 Tax=Anaerofilum hominis TaxID=2763016 RepID=A0A923IFS1_9FIRM|nr:hypothetical protein [Anaerofilum hominis]MBC5582182.1 hypothetical protein [Anaerofilum hominis]
MRRHAALLAALSLCLALTGCWQPVSLAERAVVKMICVSLHGEQYEVKLAAYVAADGDAESQGESKTVFAEGRGDAVRTALLDAQEGIQQQAFYAQNELLLVEEQAARSRLQEILTYFSEERSSRPNMAVFAYRAEEEEQLLDKENIEKTVENLEKMKNGDSVRGGLTQMIYRFDLKGERQDFFLLPRLQAGEEGAVETDRLLFLRGGREVLSLKGEEKTLAELLLGGAESYQYQNGEDSCTVSDLRTAFSVSAQGTPQLSVRLSGEVRDAPAGCAPEALESSVERRLEETFSSLYQKCYLEQELDPFQFGWWFETRDARRYGALLREKKLFGEDTLSFDAVITVDP